MKGILEDQRIHQFREALNQLPGVNLPAAVVDEGKYHPSISIASMMESKYFEVFTKEVLKLQELLT